MNTIVTKENWSSDPNNAPLPSDFNRIESNTRKVEENRQEETAAREAADTTLQENIDTEEAARVSDDAAEAIARLAGDAGYSGSTVTITDYPIGSIIIAQSINIPNKNSTVGPSNSYGGFFTLDILGSDLAGVWKARGVISAISGTYHILCQRIS